MALTKQLKPRHEGQRPLATSQGSFSSAARDQKSFEDCVHILIDGGKGLRECTSAMTKLSSWLGEPRALKQVREHPVDAPSA